MGIEQLQTKKEALLASLDQIRQRLAQLNQELQQRAAQEQQVLGALMLCDELISEAASPAASEAEPAPAS